MLTSAATCTLAQADAKLTQPHRGMLGWELAAFALVFALQAFYFTGVASTDDVAYYQYGQFIANDEPITDISYAHFLGRFVFMAFVWMASILLPNSPGAIALPSLLSCGFIMVLLARFARRYFNAPASGLAIALFGLLPLNIVMASVALPDMTAAAFATFGLVLSADVLLHKDARNATAHSLAAGLLFSMAFNVKEPAALILPGLMLFVLLYQRRNNWAWQRIGLMLLAAVCWFVAAEIVLHTLTGEWLYHFNVMKRSQRGYVEKEIALTLPVLLKYWTEYLFWMVSRWSPLTPISWILLAGVAYRLARRNMVTSLLICSILPGLLYISIGSSDLTNYYPLIHQPRHLLPFFPAMALVAADAVSGWWRSGKSSRRILLPIGLGLLLLTLREPNQLAGRWYHSQTFSAGFALAGEHIDGKINDSRLISSQMTWNRFQHFHRWMDCPKVERVNEPPTTPAQWQERYGNSYVLVSRFDTIGSYKTKHAAHTFAGLPMESLRSFERIAHREPAVDRLSTMTAQLQGKPIPTDPELAVELYYIPPAARTQ